MRRQQGLLAEAIEAKGQTARLRTEADALIAKAKAAEALASDYRALAEHPPSAHIATHYLYDPEGRLLGEYDETSRVEREYVYLEGMPLALMAPNAIYYYHTDHLGTPQSLTDSDQTVVWQAHHDPFGRASVTAQAVVNNLRFPGQYFDAETGLHYNYFRDYDPSLGRYIQSDRISVAEHVQRWSALRATQNLTQFRDQLVGVGGIADLALASSSILSPLELNPYAYVANNPLRWTDPTGESIIDGFGGSSAG